MKNWLEDEEFEIEQGRLQTTQYPSKGLRTCAEVRAVIAEEMKMSTICNIASLLSEVEEDKLISVRKVRYEVLQPGVETTLVMLVGNVTFDSIQKGNICFLLMRSNDHLP